MVASTAVLLLLLPPAQAFALAPLWVYEGKGDLTVKHIATYSTGVDWDEGGAEIVTYDAASKRLYVLSGAKRAVEIIDLSVLSSQDAVQALTLTKQIKLEDLGISDISDITSIAVGPEGEWIALSLPAKEKTANGLVAFLNREGKLIRTVTVGALPDMVGITPDGKTVFTANEGEPNEDYSIDPEGSVSLIDISGGIESLTQDDVTTVKFDQQSVIDPKVRIGKPGATYAEDLEPEYIAASEDSQTLYVSLQENNAIAVLDLTTKTFTAVHSLGYKDHSVFGQGLDASDKDGKAAIRRWPVKGAYMPDGIAAVTVDGKTYILTANEGDAREYGDFTDELRAKDIADKLALRAELYGGFTEQQLAALTIEGLLDDEQMGRLKIIADLGLNEDGQYEQLFSYGARSFSIWDADTLELVFDSGDQFERIIHNVHPEYYNVSNADAEFDNRSDDKGPEPEDVEVGWIDGELYAFVGLERDGGIMAYNITNPTAPVFSVYFSTRQYAESEGSDSGPEGLKFIPAEDSPTGNALLAVGYEVSGTVSVFELSPAPKTTKITLLHTNDTHGRADGSDGMGFAKISALAHQFAADYPNTLLLDAGDTFHGTNFATLQRGESIANVMNRVGYDAMAAGNHDFNYGYERLLELEDMTIFPVLSANVKREDGSRLLEPYVIKEVDGVKIGLFGLTTPETTYKTHPNNVEGLVFTDPAEEARHIVAELAPQVDVIIAVTHLGIDASSTDTSIKVAKEAPGIDVIVDGHSHSTLVEGLQGDHDTLIVSAGEYTKNLGVVELILDEHNRIISKTAKLITEEDASDVDADPAIEQLINEVKADQESILSEVIGYSAVRLEGDREFVRTGETNLGNLITDAMLDITGADVALTNGGGIRASIEVGEITKGDVITVLPFGNFITTKEVSGADLKAALENGASAYPESKGAFAHVSGMTYKIDASLPAGNRVHSVMVNGEPLQLDRMYTLATNDFIAAGGDEYEMFVDSPITGEYPALDEALMAYIQKIGEVNAAVEGRIQAASAAGSNPEATASATPSAQAKQPEGQQPREVYIVKSGDTLWAIGRTYQIPWQKLAEINQLQNPHLIFPGQRIIIK